MTTHSRTALLAMILASVPASAFAHTGLGDAHGFMHGFAHPLGGLDHILAMVAVGMFAASLGGWALWLVPAAFVLAMAMGGILGIYGIAVPFVETGIAASVIVLGLAVAVQLSVAVAAAMALAGFFAIFHGYAHGAEMPVDASGLTYGLGFLLATALLHAAGISIGLGIASVGARTSRIAIRVSGGAMAVAGLGLLAGYL